jgi:hypothetical protein
MRKADADRDHGCACGVRRRSSMAPVGTGALGAVVAGRKGRA